MPITRTVGGETREWNGSAWVPVATSAGQPEMYHPGLSDTPLEASAAELLRTGKEAGIGLLRSPLDLIKNTLGLVTDLPGTIKGTAHAVAHPVETVQHLGENPREAGSVLGQLLLGRYAVPQVVSRTPGALTTVGGAAERAGTALAESKVGGLGIPGFGALEAAMQGDPKGLAVAVAPYALKYGGKGLRKVGESLEGLKRATVPAEEAAEEFGPEAIRIGGVRRELPYRAPASEPYTYESSPGPQLDIVEPAVPEPQIAPTAADVDALYQSIPETPQATLPAAWQSFTENPVTQGLRQVLEELRQRPTAGLTNPTGR